MNTKPCKLEELAPGRMVHLLLPLRPLGGERVGVRWGYLAPRCIATHLTLTLSALKGGEGTLASTPMPWLPA
jgi:hypothetical protein